MNRTWMLTLGGGALALSLLAGTAGRAEAHGPFGGGPRMGLFGLRGAGEDRDEAMADALGTTVEKYRAAQDTLLAERLDAAVAAERITRDQADLLIAGRKLARSIDRRAVMAEGLGVTEAELDAGEADGKGLAQLALEKGLDRQELAEKLQAAQEAAIAGAVSDGVITQEQADQLQAAKDGVGRGGLLHRYMGGGCGGGRAAPAPGADPAASPNGIRFRPMAPTWRGSDA